METIETLRQKLQRAEQHRPAEAKYPTDLMIDIRGPQGNVFYLFGIADKLTRQLALSDEEINEFKQERDALWAKIEGLKTVNSKMKDFSEILAHIPAEALKKAFDELKG